MCAWRAVRVQGGACACSACAVRGAVRVQRVCSAWCSARAARVQCVVQCACSACAVPARAEGSGGPAWRGRRVWAECPAPLS